MKYKPRYRVFIISDKLYWRGDNTMSKRPTIKKFCDKKKRNTLHLPRRSKKLFCKMQLIELTEEQPKEQDFYFVIWKGGIKAVMWWNGTEFERDNVAHNKFCKEDCRWIKMK